jgi:hypothetical protein
LVKIPNFIARFQYKKHLQRHEGLLLPENNQGSESKKNETLTTKQKKPSQLLA